jgi:hypothetical protein
MSVTYPEHIFIDASFPHDEGDLATAIETQSILTIAILRNTLADKLSGDDNADKAWDAVHALLVVQAHPTGDRDRVAAYSDGSEVISMTPTDPESAPEIRVSEVITDSTTSLRSCRTSPNARIPGGGQPPARLRASGVTSPSWPMPASSIPVREAMIELSDELANVDAAMEQPSPGTGATGR